MKKLITLSIAAMLSATVFAAGPRDAPHAAGIESKDYQWAKMEGEMKEALAVKGEAKKVRKVMKSAAPATCPPAPVVPTVPSRNWPASTPRC